MIGLVARTLRVLNSETAPAQIGAAVGLACVMGLTPLWTLHNLLLLLLVLVVRVNLSIFIVAWGIFTGIAFLLDPVFDMLGHAVLTADALRPLWSAFQATDIGRLSDFSNTVVMGSLLFCIAAVPVVWYASVFIVRHYRRHLLTWVQRTRLAEIVRGSRVYQLYQSLPTS